MKVNLTTISNIERGLLNKRKPPSHKSKLKKWTKWLHKTLRLSTKPIDCPHLANSSTKVKIFHKMASIVSTHEKIKNDRRKWKCQLTFLFRRLFLTSLCFCVYGCKGMGHVGEVWVFDRSVVCSWECLHVKRGRGKTVREFHFQFQTVTILFVFSFERDRREGVVYSCWGSFWHAVSKKRRCLGTTFPPKAQSPKCPTRHRFGNFYFPPKVQHGTVLAIFISPQKPTRHRFGNFYFPPKAHTMPFWGPTFPPNFPRWTRPFFLSFLVSLLFWLVWFKWINGFGLFFNLG